MIGLESLSWKIIVICWLGQLMLEKLAVNMLFDIMSNNVTSLKGRKKTFKGMPDNQEGGCCEEEPLPCRRVLFVISR